MPPHRYSIRLNGHDRQTLRRQVRAGNSERRIADRSRIVLWTAEGKSTQVISERLGINRSTVIFWRKRYVEGAQQGIGIAERLRDNPRSGRPPKFSASQIAQTKAVACERPAELGLPLSRFSLSEIMLWIKQAEVVSSISISSIWRLLHQDAIRPWYYRGWLFPRDPAFAEKAGPILDLYQRQWRGEPLGPHDCVISADEKSGLQVLGRIHPTLPPLPGLPGLCEFEYERNGTVAYLAALDVFTGQVFGRIEDKTGIEPFGRLVDQVMQQAPFCTAQRVFWIVDGGSSHHPSTSPARLQACHPNIEVVHTPTHSSWLNQIEIFFSIVQRKALTPMDLGDRDALANRILSFQAYYNTTAKPFNWKFTRAKLQDRLRAVPKSWSENL